MKNSIEGEPRPHVPQPSDQEDTEKNDSNQDSPEGGDVRRPEWDNSTPYNW